MAPNYYTCDYVMDSKSPGDTINVNPPKFKVGDKVKSRFDSTKGEMGVIVGRSDFAGSWLIDGFTDGVKCQGFHSYCEGYLELVKEKVSYNQDYKYGCDYGKSPKTYGDFFDRMYGYADSDWFKEYMKISVDTDYKPNKTFKNMLQKIPNTLKRVLNKELSSLYKVGFINGDLDLTETGRRELTDVLFVENQTQLAERANAIIKEEKDNK